MRRSHAGKTSREFTLGGDGSSGTAEGPVRAIVRRCLALAALATAIGPGCTCSGEPLDPGADAGSGEPQAMFDAGGDDVTVVDLCTIMKTSQVNRDIFYAAQDRCMAGEAPAFLESLPDGPARVAALRAECKAGDEIYDRLDRGIKGGRARFNVDRLAVCLAKGRMGRKTASPAIFEREILDAISEDDDCKGSWTSFVAENDVCLDEWDCPRDTACEADDPTAATLRCLKPAGPGAPCGQFRRCDPATLYCGAAGTCIARVTIGDGCSSSSDCVTDAYCAAAKTCKAIPEEGALCEGVCADGLQCKAGSCVATPAPAADGALCDGTTCARFCSVCRPEYDGAPPSQFKCLARAPAGGPCGSSDASCIAGFYCNASSGRCEPPLGAGADCVPPGLPCAKGLWCDALGTQKCIALPGLSSACYKGQCATDLFCSANLCIAGKAGDRCNPADGTVCQSSLFCAGTSGAETCQPLPKASEACPTGLCAKGAFCNAKATCEAKRAAGATCDNADQCPGECYKGKCAPRAPVAGCGDLRHDLAAIFAMGMLGVFARRRKGPRQR